MIIWDDSITLLQKFTNDNSTGSLAFQKQLLNIGFKTILGKLRRDVQEKTKTSVTVADQQYYQLPNDFLRLVALKITVGSTVYNVTEEESQSGWDSLNMMTETGDIPSRYYIRRGFGLGGSEIGIYPIPSSADNVITVIYEATDRDLSQAAYTTGTVALTNGSATVTGSGTTFLKSMIGRYFANTDADGDGMWYRISGYTSGTVLTLENVYEGETDATANYKIAEAFGLPEDTQMLPIYWAAWHYYASKKDAKEEGKWKMLFDTELILAQRRYNTKSSSSTLSNNGVYGTGSNPPFFPTSLAS